MRVAELLTAGVLSLVAPPLLGAFLEAARWLLPSWASWIGAVVAYRGAMAALHGLVRAHRRRAT